MKRLRHMILDRQYLAMTMIVAALLMRLLVPVGFMPEVSAGKITMVLCTGHGPAVVAVAVPTADKQDGKGAPTRSDMPCPFAAGSAHGLAAADPILLAIAIAFIMALCLRPTAVPRLVDAPRLRPPLRGPPLTA
jgi:hypothetical protein